MVLPKLALVITVASDASQPIERLSLTVFRDDERVIDIAVSPESLRKLASRRGRRPSAEHYQVTRRALSLQCVIAMALSD